MVQSLQPGVVPRAELLFLIDGLHRQFQIQETSILDLPKAEENLLSHPLVVLELHLRGNPFDVAHLDLPSPDVSSADLDTLHRICASRHEIQCTHGSVYDI